MYLIFSIRYNAFVSFTVDSSYPLKIFGDPKCCVINSVEYIIKILERSEKINMIRKYDNGK